LRKAACVSACGFWTALSLSARLPPESAAGEAALGGGTDFLQPIVRRADAVNTARTSWLFMPPKYNPVRSGARLRFQDSHEES